MLSSWADYLMGANQDDGGVSQNDDAKENKNIDAGSSNNGEEGDWELVDADDGGSSIGALNDLELSSQSGKATPTSSCWEPVDSVHSVNNPWSLSILDDFNNLVDANSSPRDLSLGRREGVERALPGSELDGGTSNRPQLTLADFLPDHGQIDDPNQFADMRRQQKHAVMTTSKQRYPSKNRMERANKVEMVNSTSSSANCSKRKKRVNNSRLSSGRSNDRNGH